MYPGAVHREGEAIHIEAEVEARATKAAGGTSQEEDIITLNLTGHVNIMKCTLRAQGDHQEV